ncbi:MAG: polysaccharide biosynthesis C-terminal domain-containing protein [Erysipelotrichaceae bacterium]
MDKNKLRKQSIIAGGLTSTAGIFISKVMGILYVVPFSAMAGDNLTYYARAYSIYDVILSITVAGIPFAIATMIAKYVVRDDYKTVVLIRRLSTGFLLAFGFLAMSTVLLFAGPIGGFSLKALAGSIEYERTRIVLMIISADMFCAPLLSSFRGFHQGFKNLKSYAFSQVLEQFSRIVFMLGLGFLAVYILHADSMWAVYFAIAATSISSVVAIIYFLFIDKRDYPAIKEKARIQEAPPVATKTIVREMFAIAIPYVVIILLGSNMNIANLLFFNQAMLAHGATMVQTNLLYSILSFTSAKLMSIPIVISMGFSIAIIPYLTTALEQGDRKLTRKYVEDAMDTVLYLGVPLCFFLFAISTEIYYTMYGLPNYELGGYVLAIASPVALLSTFNPILSSLMMTLRLRKVNIFNLLIGFVIALVTIYPFVMWFGFPGVILSSVVSSLYIMAANLYRIHENTDFSFRTLMKRLMVILLGVAAMQIVFMLLRLVGLDVVQPNRLLSLFYLGIYGVLGVAAYIGMTGMFSLPQILFNTNFDKLKAKVLRR